MMQKKSEDAVSPVIGVMLMLVVTIVIAGVIAVFATGMAGNTETAPNVVLDVKILSNFEALADEKGGSLSGPDFQIRHVSGDPLDTEDIEIQIAWTDQNDNFHNSIYSAAEFKQKYETIGNEGTGARKQPMYVKTPVPKGDYTYGSGYSGTTVNYNFYFGDAVLTPGLRLTASADFLPMETGKVINNKGSWFMDAVFNNGIVLTDDPTNKKGIMEYLPAGTPVEITILHIPSDTIIYEKEVVVQ